MYVLLFLSPELQKCEASFRKQKREPYCEVKIRLKTLHKDLLGSKHFLLLCHQFEKFQCSINFST